MRKRNNRSSKPGKNKVVILLAVLLAVIAVFLACLIGYILKNDSRTEQPGESTALPQVTDSPEATTAPPVQMTQPPETTVPDDKLPYLLEDGKLEIESLFQYTGLNPDAGWEEGRNVGAMVLHNRSDEYLESLELTLTMSDGVQLRFLIYDIPAGKTVWAYESGNTAYDAGSIIEDVQYTAVFRQDSGLTSDQVTVSVNTMEVTLTNVSGEDLSNLEIHCHNMVDGIYFGGTVYVYPVETLISGESVTVMAMDCFLGEAAVSIVDFSN